MRRLSSTFIALALLFGCADPEPAEPTADASTARLFTRAYDDIVNFYIEPRAPRDLTLAALQRLSTVDPALVVSLEGNAIVLHDRDAVIEQTTMLEARDTVGWGAATARILSAAARRSRAIAALPKDEQEKALFSGITATLDRFSRYATPDVAREERAAREGFDGIGITLDSSTDDIVVRAIVSGSPADRAGVRVNDRIISIDDVATDGISRDEVVRRLRGPADSRVDIVLRRSGEPAPLHLDLARAYIIAPTVTARRDDGIAVLRISSFNERTTEMLREELAKLRHDGHGALRGVVLDLRGNPGGLLDQAVSVAGAFMHGGRVVSTNGRNPGSIQEFDAKHGDIAEGLPMVVLVNGGSASSAEIVAAALQDTGRAVVVGSSSFGKGTVQMVLPMPNEGDLVLTWARLVSPAGYVLHEHGVVPSVCTAGITDPDAPLAGMLKKSGNHVAGDKAKASLDDAEWSRLRGSCPGETKDHAVDVQVAERLLGMSALYARLSHVELPAVAARGALPHIVQ